ncbi:MAG TPA: LysR substrate-binding domain-containing protein [Rhodocyclaceae bacterium]|nr:LysR substrate-binding domain-containing protein [Rhodocyclaceae bacterium]
MISRKYLYLIALAREKHFGRAAAACHISPSTLSTAIRDLEAELGVTIAERGQQFSGLTPEGRCVVEYAQRLAANAEGLRQELSRLRDGLSGRLRLGVIPTALTVVASLTSAFARRHPLVNIEVLSLSTGEILQRLREFQLEAGVVYQESGNGPDLESVPLWNENHVFVTSENNPLAERESITWREAAQMPLVLLTKDMQNRKITDRVFHELGCDPKPSLETNSIVSILAHVRTGQWSGILPRGVLEQIGLPEGLRRVDLVEPSVGWATCLVIPGRTIAPQQTPLTQALMVEAQTLL